MDGDEYRFATALEIQHYRELIKPITDYMDQHGVPANKMTKGLRVVAHKVMMEMGRFGFSDSAAGLMVKMDPSCYSPVPTPEQEAATLIDLEYLYGRVSGKTA